LVASQTLSKSNGVEKWKHQTPSTKSQINFNDPSD
jgi:hypothetical protein